MRGTPLSLPLRTAQQERVVGAAPPALVGTWDIWPMLTSASAGYEERDDLLAFLLTL